jgi:hypothetical protein
LLLLALNFIMFKDSGKTQLAPYYDLATFPIF